MRTPRRLVPLVVVAALTAACSGKSAPRQEPAAPAAEVTLTAIAVLPGSPDPVPLGLPIRFTATGTYSDGSTADLTANVVWRSSSEAVATISNGAASPGLTATLSKGTTEISATDPASTIAASATLSVTDAQLVSVAVAPTDPTLLAGSTLQLSALGTLTDASDADVTASLTWTSDNEAAATVSASGLVQAIAVGTATITAMDPVTATISGSTTITVTSVPAVLAYVTLSRGSVVGGGPVQVTGTVVLTSPPTEAVTIALASSDPAVTVPASVDVPPGADRVSFSVTTAAVSRKTRVTITATDDTPDGVLTKTATLNVRVPKR